MGEIMKKLIFGTFALAITAMAGSMNVSAQMSKDGNPTVGGAAMYKTKNIVENAVNSKDHTTLIAAVKAAGLVETLKTDGPFTVFAPTNAAFEKLPEGTIPTLLKPENKAALTSVLTYHVIAGKINATSLMEWIQKNNGTYTAKTIQGGELKFIMDKKNN